MRKLLPVLLALSLPVAAHAQADPDGARACITPERSTSDAMALCLDRVRAVADARLNATYQRALESLSPGDAQALREAQRAWLAFRERDVASLRGGWRAQREVSVRIYAAEADVEAINGRERQLRVYLENTSH